MRHAPLLVALAACGPAQARPSVDPSAWAGRTPVNPTQDGQLVYRSYGDHHPDCFVFVGEEGGATENITCPTGAIAQLASCPGGKLYAPAGEPCICVPLDGEPLEVSCPE